MDIPVWAESFDRRSEIQTTRKYLAADNVGSLISCTAVWFKGGEKVLLIQHDQRPLLVETHGRGDVKTLHTMNEKVKDWNPGCGEINGPLLAVLWVLSYGKKYAVEKLLTYHTENPFKDEIWHLDISKPFAWLAERKTPPDDW